MEPTDEPFLRVAAAVRRLFHLLRAVAERASPPLPGFTVSHRGVLESLHDQGAATVPAMARARPVARQHIQVLVNGLLAMGLVETRPNPAHRRSPIVALTARGRRQLEAIRAAEGALFACAHLPLSPDELGQLADHLAVLASGLHALVDG